MFISLPSLKVLTPVQFGHSVVSNSLQPHGLQHTRLPSPSPTPRACSNSCASSQWCHPNTSCSVIPFSSCLQSFPASQSFPMSQFFTSGGQSVKSFSFSLSPSNEYSGLISFRMDWWISLQSKGRSLMLSFLYSPTLTSIHDYWKNHSFD